jgi:hypothetical protein
MSILSHAQDSLNGEDADDELILELNVDDQMNDGAVQSPELSKVCVPTVPSSQQRAHANCSTLTYSPAFSTHALRAPPVFVVLFVAMFVSVGWQVDVFGDEIGPSAIYSKGGDTFAIAEVEKQATTNKANKSFGSVESLRALSDTAVNNMPVRCPGGSLTPPHTHSLTQPIPRSLPS